MGNRKKKGKLKPHRANPKILRQILLDLATSPDRELFKFQDDRIEPVNSKTKIWTKLSDYLRSNKLLNQYMGYQIRNIFISEYDKRVRQAWGLSLPLQRIRKGQQVKTMSPRKTRQDKMNGVKSEDCFEIPPLSDEQEHFLLHVAHSMVVTDQVGNKHDLSEIRNCLSTRRDFNVDENMPRQRRFVDAVIIDLLANLIFQSGYKIFHLVLPSTFYMSVHKILVKTKLNTWEDFELCKSCELPTTALQFEPKINYEILDQLIEKIRENPFEREVVFIPVLLYKHASVLVIYPQEKVMQYHDGLEHKFDNNDKRIEVFWEILEHLHNHFLKKPFANWSLYRLVDKMGSVQIGASDCVPVTLWTMELLLGRHVVQPNAFMEESMINYRRQLLCDLASGEMVWERPKARETWPKGHFKRGAKTPRPTPTEDLSDVSPNGTSCQGTLTDSSESSSTQSAPSSDSDSESEEEAKKAKKRPAAAKSGQPAPRSSAVSQSAPTVVRRSARTRTTTPSSDSDSESEQEAKKAKKRPAAAKSGQPAPRSSAVSQSAPTVVRRSARTRTTASS